jgi:hypothetical protein
VMSFLLPGDQPAEAEAPWRCASTPFHRWRRGDGRGVEESCSLATATGT